MKILIQLILLCAYDVAFAASVNLAWDASQSPNVAGYKVHVGTTQGVYDSTIDTGSVTSFTVDNLADDTNYYFVASAYGTCDDGNGNQVPCESVNSNEIPWINDTTPPPTGGTLYDVGDTIAGASEDSSNSNWINVLQVTTGPEDINLTLANVHVADISAAPNNQFEVAIYSDNNGAPGSLIAVSDTGTLIANDWASTPISGTLSANTAYWLAYNTNGLNSGVNNLTYDSDLPVSGWHPTGVNFGTWPTTFGGFTSASTSFSIYVTGVSPSSQPTVNPPTGLRLIP